MKNYKRVDSLLVFGVCILMLGSLLAACSSTSMVLQARLDVDSYVLDADASSLNFVSIKQGSVAEIHQFTRLSGLIENESVARLRIDLSSVDSGISLRDHRMKEHLFDVSRFAQATVFVSFDKPAVRGLDLGQSVELDVEATLGLHGIEAVVPAKVLIVRQKTNALIVSTIEPVLISAEQFSLQTGIAQLQELAGLESIATAVPVSFALQFNPE